MQLRTLALQCIENLIREDLKPIEEAKAFRTLSTVNNWSGNQLAKELGISQSAVAQALALLELPEPIQASVEAGELAPSTAYAIAKLEDPAAQAEVAARVVAEGLSRAEATKVVDETMARASGSKSKIGKGRGASKAKAKLPTERTLKVDGGFKIVVTGRKGFDVLAWVEALEEATRQARAKLEPVEQGGDSAAA